MKHYLPMRALYINSGAARLRNIARPRRPAGWARIQVLASGICNTDLELLRGYYGFRGVPGHEFIGRVLETSAKDAGWRGRRVTGEINITCRGLGQARLCDLCARGLVSHCRRRIVLGIVHHPGAHAEEITLPICNLHAVPARISDHAAVFAEPLAAACQVLKQVRFAPRDRVLVLGDGKLGLLIAQVLHRELGKTAATVLLAGRHGDKLALARRWGVETKLSGAKLGRREWDVVIEATGSPKGLAAALELVRPRGTVVMKSTVHGKLQTDTAPWIVDEITLVGSRCGPMDMALRLLARGLEVESLIEDVLPLARAPQALRRAARRGSRKILLAGEVTGSSE